MNTSRRSFLRLAGTAAAGHAVSRSLLAADDRAPLPTLNHTISSATKSARLTMLFEGRTPQELAAWQQRFSQKMLELIGPCAPPVRWTARTLSTATFPDFIREELLLSADGAPPLPVYLLRPAATRAEKFPVVLCLHGHGTEGHDSVAGRDDIPEVAEQIKKYNYDYARTLVRRGYVTVAPCFTPFGRRVDASIKTLQRDPCAMAFIRLAVLGRTLLAENIRDARWALSYALSRPEARADRAGCVGLSYGGRMTMMTAAFDARVKVAVISGAQNFYEERLIRDQFCGGQVIPGMMEYGDIPEIGSLIAPRPAIWETGDADIGMDPAGKVVIRERLERAYAAAGKPAALSFHSFKGAHVWDGTTAVPLLARELQS